MSRIVMFRRDRNAEKLMSSVHMLKHAVNEISQCIEEVVTEVEDIPETNYRNEGSNQGGNYDLNYNQSSYRQSQYRMR